MNDDLRRTLESLADRGEPRGADAVLAAARRQVAAAASARRPMHVAAGLAAAVLAVIGTTAVAVHEDAHDQQLAGSAATATTADWDLGSPAVPTVTTDPPNTTSTAVPPRLTREQRASRLQRYSSCGAVVAASRRKALEVVGPYGMPGQVHVVDDGGRVGERRAVSGGDATSGGETGAPATTVAEGDTAYEYSEAMSTVVSENPKASDTNVQETGVDEPDTVETDGRRLFTLREGRLWYSTVENGKVQIQGSIALERPRNMVLVGDRMVVFGERYGDNKLSAVVSVIDVRTPQMGVASSLVLDGYHVSARVVDGVVRAVVHGTSGNLPWQRPAGPTEADMAAAAAHNRDLVARAPADTWLPSLVVEDGLQRVRATRSLVDCEAAYRPQRFAGFSLLTVLTLDPADPDGITSTAVHADGDRVYASRDRLYIATNGWQSVAKDGLDVVPDPVTHIHAFDINDRSRARYTVSGRVQGSTIGQFAFSEHEGHLRVASTVQGATSESYVTVLRDNGAALEEVGRVGGLGPTEQIQAVRFMGPLGYVVTFRQTDPLYVVDLSDPRAPRVAGELKIPGFSSYLHPIGPGLLLGVGQDADEQGNVRGAQFSVFDVSDPSKPTRIHQVTLSQGSTTESDHHAFLWWAATRLALVPFWEYRPDGNADVGVVGLTAGRDELRELGRIRHPAPSPTPVERSVVIGSTVFTISPAGILASDLATLAQGEWAPYPASTE